MPLRHSRLPVGAGPGAFIGAPRHFRPSRRHRAAGSSPPSEANGPASGVPRHPLQLRPLWRQPSEADDEPSAMQLAKR
jgi:hypothetical protein